MPSTFDIAAYVWPSYTGDEPPSRIFWPKGIGEWQTVRDAVAKFPGHQWPRRPLWGYVNEADPGVMEQQIDAAADHGVNVLIYDWYWYDRRPFLENCLNDGFLRAGNNGRMKFYLMWANHDAEYLWDKRLAGSSNAVVWQGGVDRREFEVIADRVIEKYFNHPCYYRIAGKPVFQIYDLANLIKGLGGVKATRQAFDWFQARARAAGLPGVHLQMTLWGERSFASDEGDGKGISGRAISELLDFESLSHYQFCHFVNIDRDYDEIIPDVEKEWLRIRREYPIPYFPHVSVGWDTNPRFKSLQHGIVKNNTPAAIERALRRARSFVESHSIVPPLITINSWNEWTETSYLEPDDLYGYGYLEAIRNVFGR